MTTFDQILPGLARIFQNHHCDLAGIAPILVNRDLNGRVRLIVDKTWRDDASARAILKGIAHEIHQEVAPHAYAAESALLFESDLATLLTNESTFLLEGCPNIHVVDRLAVDSDWTRFAPEAKPPRIVFYSIKGGVGRSTALAATAWTLAEEGKKVLVLDLDLESPGLSSSLLPEERRPTYGITDWLVEDLVDNGAAVLDDMVAASTLSRNGDILVVPAHGKEPGEYVAKLGRVWMPKMDQQGHRDGWAKRLHRLLDELARRWSPDVILIDSRAGIDEVASACITELGASLILLFAIDGDQTWTGYRALFDHWLRTGVAVDIRERLQMVGAMIPEIGHRDYFDSLRERSWDTFIELYTEVPAGAVAMDGGVWSFDGPDELAPHYPWAVRWHRSFAALRSLHGRLQDIEPAEVENIFGRLIAGVRLTLGSDVA